MVEVKTGMLWPPKADRERLARYELYRKFFRGEHLSAFRYLGSKCEDTGLQRKIYLICNYAGLMSRKCADFLVGEPPTYLVSGGRRRSTLTKNLNRLAETNRLNPLLYKTELATSYRGDGIFRVRDNGRHTVIDQVAAPNYFVRTNPDDPCEVEAEAIAWTRQVGNKHFLRVEHHIPGKIIQEAFEIGKPELGSQRKIGPQASLRQVYGEDRAEVRQTGVPGSLLFTRPIFSVDDDVWGISDYDGGIDSIFEALNNRMSKIDAYLDRHSRPILIGMDGMADKDGNQGGSEGGQGGEQDDFFLPNDLEAAKFLPRYVTWDGQMNPAFRQIEQLLDELFRLTEMAPAMFGLDKAGSIESSKAMKLRFVNTRAKINRKRALMDPQLRDALFVALLLDHIRYGGPDPESHQVKIEWQDGIPEDYREQIEAEEIRIRSGTSSKQGAIERIDRKTPEQAREERARIRAEQAEEELARPQAGRDTQTKPGEAGVQASPTTGESALNV